MKCFHLPVLKANGDEFTVHVNADLVESIVPNPKGEDVTHVIMCSGDAFITSLTVDTVLKRINEAHVRHSRNGGS